MDGLIYALDFVLLFSCLIDAWCRTVEQRFSVGIVRILLLIPLLAVFQLYFSAGTPQSLIAPLFFSENIFALTWILLAIHLQSIMTPAIEKSLLCRLSPYIIGILGLGSGGFWISITPDVQFAGSTLIFPHFGALFISSMFVLVSVLAMAWRLEAFWRSLDRKARSLYKYMVLAFFLVIGSMAWSSSFRLTYLCLKSDHLVLLSLLLLLAWSLAVYGVASSRLLNRKIFVSRKIVYATVAPFVFAIYLISLGFISFLMALFGWSLPFVLKWLLIVVGAVMLAILSLSSGIRNRVRYFISTHFYVNKYEYRNEWLNFSNLLHHKLTETGVVDALLHILKASLYTDTIKIWIGDEKAGFHLTNPSGSANESQYTAIAADDPVISYLHEVSYLDCQSAPSDPENTKLLSVQPDFLKSMGLVFLTPLAIGGHFVGLIGLGPEYTGGQYGKDDFDLLAAISSQAASALLAVRMAEELARAREQSAWQTLSTFVLHDIKNAATMLSLVQKNAPQHIHNPDFQQDMLSSVDDALKRMNKVQTRLNTLKGDIEPSIKTLDAGQLLQEFSNRISRKIPQINLSIASPSGRSIHTDPNFIGIILENLVLNAVESGTYKNGAVNMQIRLEIAKDNGFQIECTDNGPGIPLEVLPDRLFEPFISTKPSGSGIGLWQVKKLVENLGGRISAQNNPGGGACFLLIFPRSHFSTPQQHNTIIERGRQENAFGIESQMSGFFTGFHPCQANKKALRLPCTTNPENFPKPSGSRMSLLLPYSLL